MRWFRPLWTFIGGMIGFLGLSLLFPKIEEVFQIGAGLEGTGNFWGWAWITSSPRLIIFVIYLLLLLFVVGWELLDAYSGR